MQMFWVGISMISTSCHFHHGYNVFFIKGSKTTQPQKAATDLREVPKFTHPHEEQVGSKTTSPEPALVWTIMSTNVSRPDGKWMLWSSLILQSKRAVPCPQASKPLEIAAAPQNTSVRLYLLGLCARPSQGSCNMNFQHLVQSGISGSLPASEGML